MSLFGDPAKPPEADMLPEFRQAGWAAGGLAKYILGAKHNPYAGDRVANLTTGQTSLIDMLTKRGLMGDPTLKGANTYALDVMNGKYLDQNNPYLAQAAAAAQDEIGRALGDQFAGSATAGSPNQFQDYASEFSKAAAPLYFQNYQNERNIQNQMAGLAPTLNAAGTANLQAGLGAQGILQQQQQQEIDAQMARYNEAISEPTRRLQAVMSAIGGNMNAAGNYGGSPGSAGLVSGLLGGASSGAMAGSAAGPWGAVIGGLLGGAGGAFANR